MKERKYRKRNTEKKGRERRKKGMVFQAEERLCEAHA
jgi:hypothetical protein